MTVPVLDTRTLNRTLLARQHLLHRSAVLTPYEMIGHLVGMQAQNPDDPYLGLWARLEAFDPAVVGTALDDRSLVRTWVMRTTVHLVTAPDARVLLPLHEPVRRRGFAGNFGRHVDPADQAAIEMAAERLLATTPHTRADAARALAVSFPHVELGLIGYAATIPLALVQIPPRGVWGRSGSATLTTAASWLGAPVAESSLSVDHVVRRYLAAFGPATNADIRTWCGIPGLREVTNRLRPELVTYRDDTGRELFDLPGLDVVGGDTPAPVRFLPEFDNVFLSHQERSRIIDPATATTRRLTVERTSCKVLVDGFVAAEWRLRRDGSALDITPYRQLTGEETDDVISEATRLLGHLSPGSTAPVEFNAPVDMT